MKISEYKEAAKRLKEFSKWYDAVTLKTRLKEALEKMQENGQWLIIGQHEDLEIIFLTSNYVN